jgi:hypothetical protein
LRLSVLLILVAACDSSNSKSENDLSAAMDMAMSSGKDAAVDSGAVVTVDSGVTMSYTYNAIDGDGAFHVVTVDHGKGTVKSIDTTNAYTLAGTFETLASGYLKVTFNAGCNGAACTPTVSSSVNGPGGAVALPTGAHGIEAPGALVVFLGDSLMGGAVGTIASDCSTDAFGTYVGQNVNTPQGSNLFTDFAYSQTTLSGTATNVTASNEIFPLTADGGVTPPSTGTCSAGVVSFPGAGGNTGATVLESGSNGVVLVDNSSGGGNVLAVGLKHSALTLADLENQSYSGYNFITMSNSGGVEYASLVFGNSAAGNGRPFADPDANTIDPDPSHAAVVTLTGIDNGVISGTLSGSTTGTLRGAGIKAGGRTILVLTGDLNGDGTQILTVVVVSH